ncbi:ferredoxin--NADP reductase [Pseudoalteromonas peptidolytica]|uniref:ferredoxin--NADP(+) reductase n=1 Tax=Pseudoalteromonas peptidolytica F12-50-A1 TaxID=1315280 RepID=A0A8I0N1L7_9GAMM|nr:ferredoxin--NADP reductase [Pseudoalteromonas peptidolytica]MBE0349166.1 ferredoxin--NADP+ reductase [Pseudoalteromonas peptidolytica F12-50-A1]NLR16224.1 ferredoxin--NADP reductase [Pseudoalteromonas peptidolytica]GEK11309.1 ferredoxin--NADP(+) reductase [Pseudoalteromonas peptidolytica]
MSQWVKGEVIDIVHWTQTLFSIRFRADIAPFKAGQYTKLSLVEHDVRTSRAYSFVNSPSESTHEVLVVSVPEGNLSPALHQLKAGDFIEVSHKANGFFTLDELPPCDTLWMICTGTAIGPFLSMLDDGEIWQRVKQVHLIHGVRLNADLCYRAKLEQLQAQRGEFTYIPLVTREQPEVGYQGRVTELVENKQLLAHFGYLHFPDKSHFMLCGNPDMVKQLSAQLQKMGFERHRRAKPGQITVEQYW